MRVTKVTGFQQLTAANLAAAIKLAPVAHAQTGENPNAAIMTSFTGNVRYTDDGTTTPTAAIGMRIIAGQPPYLYQGDMQKFQAILEGGSPTLDISYVIVAD